MKILVTGANGMLGSNLCTMYSKEHDVFASDRTIPDFSACENIKLDITEENDLKIIEQIKPDMIINCAALVNVDYCEDHPQEAIKVNCTGTAKLAETASAARAGECYFVHISTDAIFDGESGNYREESIPDPINIYGKSKLCAEKVVSATFNEKSNYVIIRTNIIGWSRRNTKSLAEWILYKLEKGEKISAFKDVLFSPILVNQLGDNIIKLKKAKYHGIINLAASNGCTKLEFANMIANAFGLNANVIYPVFVGDMGLRAKRARNMVLDVSRANRIPGIELMEVEKGIKRFKELKDNGFLEILRMKQGS